VLVTGGALDLLLADVFPVIERDRCIDVIAMNARRRRTRPC
jgi:hypothetical protein